MIPAEKPIALLQEFRSFALKGNVIDLAVGVIIGAAFGKIIDSLVKHLLMPIISLLLPGDESYLAWKFVVGSKEVAYGLFIGEILNFIIVTVALFFFIVKFLGWVMKVKKEEAAAAPKITKEQELLTEIRDLLRGNPRDAARPVRSDL